MIDTVRFSKPELTHFVKSIFCLVLLFTQTNLANAQQKRFLFIEKKNGSYHKTIHLPANIRVVMNNRISIIIRADSITNDYIYSNQAKDSLAIKNVRSIHLRGMKEIIKFTGVLACAVITGVALWFTNQAAHGRVATDIDNSKFILPGLVYAGTFASLGTIIYLYPKTRFPVRKYNFSIR